MHRFYNFLLFFLFMFCIHQVKAQQNILEVDSFSGFTTNDTLVYGNKANLKMIIRNISDSNMMYVGRITVYMKTNLDPKPAIIYQDTVNDTIFFNSTKIIETKIDIIEPYFDKNEKSIIVVWPTGTGDVFFKPNKDSIQTGLYVERNVSIKETENTVKYVRFYPNPTDCILHYEITDRNAKITGIKILDLQGRNTGLVHSDLLQNKLDLTYYKAGIYVVEINFANGEIGRYRIIKSQ